MRFALAMLIAPICERGSNAEGARDEGGVDKCCICGVVGQAEQLRHNDGPERLAEAEDISCNNSECPLQAKAAYQSITSGMPCASSFHH